MFFHNFPINEIKKRIFKVILIHDGKNTRAPFARQRYSALHPTFFPAWPWSLNAFRVCDQYLVLSSVKMLRSAVRNLRVPAAKGKCFYVATMPLSLFSSISQQHSLLLALPALLSPLLLAMPIWTWVLPMITLILWESRRMLERETTETFSTS